MRRWRRLAILALVALAVVAALRTIGALRPPHIAVAPERRQIDGITVINPGRDRRPAQTIVLRGGVIESIRDAVPAAQRLPRDRLFDEGYALPGLIDLDVRRLPTRPHLRRLAGIWFLNAGVTTVRVSGGLDADLPALQREIADGEIPWPRLVACAPLLTGDGVACPGARVVRDASEATAAVDAAVAAGAPCVAAHRSLGEPAVAALRARAAAKGLAVVGDVAGGGRLISAAPPAPPAQTAADWLRGWQASAIDLTSLPPLTSGVQRWLWLAQPDAPANIPFAPLLPRFYRDVVWPRQRAEALATPGGALGAEDVRLAAAAMVEQLRRRHDAGAPILVGSGTPGPYLVPGVSLWFEMLSLNNAGLPLEDLWAAATRGAGAALSIAKLGILEEGAPADLLIFREDPTRDAAAFISLQAVVSNGRLYPARILNGDMLEYARYGEQPLYDWFATLAARLGIIDEVGDPNCEPL